MPVPAQIRSGDTTSWSMSLPDYLPAQSWALTFYFSRGPEAPIAVPANADGALFLVKFVPDWEPGRYSWTARVRQSGTGDVYVVDAGVIDVVPDPSKANDPRTHEERCLAAISAVLEGRMGDSIVEYKLDGKTEAKHLPHDQLLKLRNYYAEAVRRQRGGRIITSLPISLAPTGRYRGL